MVPPSVELINEMRRKIIKYVRLKLRKLRNVIFAIVSIDNISQFYEKNCPFSIVMWMWYDDENYFFIK